MPYVRTLSSSRFLLLGLAVIVLLGIVYLAVNTFTRPVSAPLKIQATPIASDTGEINTQDNQNNSAASTRVTSYTVKKGDTLWSIAQQYYGTGYAWSQIAKANNLQNPQIIHQGNILNMQGTSQYPLLSNLQAKPNIGTSQISGHYTVVNGDTLWSIAQRAYDNPYKWTVIAQANKIANPRKLAVGTILTIPPST